MYQIGYSNNSPTPISSAMHSDGTFINDNIFNGNYKLVATGPFLYIDTINVNINGKTSQDIKVIPNVMVKMGNVIKTETSITIEVKVTQDAAASDQKIARIAALAGTTNSVNNFSAIALQNTESTSNEDVVATTYSLTLSGLKSKTSYYVRAGARTIK